MHTEDFVTYEQAVKLKELGFNWKCNHYYYYDKIVEVNLSYELSNYYDFNNDSSLNSKFVMDKICSAPTLAQAQKWLREAKGISIEPFSSVVEKNWAYQLYHSTKDKFGLSIVVDKKCVKEYGFNTYELALSAGIDKALQYLKQQNNGK